MGNAKIVYSNPTFLLIFKQCPPFFFKSLNFRIKNSISSIFGAKIQNETFFEGFQTLCHIFLFFKEEQSFVRIKRGQHQKNNEQMEDIVKNDDAMRQMQIKQNG